MRMNHATLLLTKNDLLKRIVLVLAAALGLMAIPASSQEIAITFDDLPAHSVLPTGTTRLDVAEAVIHALHDAGVPATYGFVNGIHVEQQPGDAAVLDLWRRSGNLLGNHTWSHMNLNEHSPEEFEADIAHNEPLIRDRMQGLDWRWLRYPYLAEGDSPAKRDAVRAYLAQQHYQIAAVTMSFGDYLWNEPYARCMAKGDSQAITLLESSYLQAASEDVAYRREMTTKLFGHDIPYVLLMHIGAFDAHMLPRLLKLYRTKGFQFVSLDKAESDPFYANDVNPGLPGVPDTLEAASGMHHIRIVSRPASGPSAASLCL